MTSERILVAVATYNEIETLPHLVDEIHRRLPTVELLVVDDDSPDGTGDWCDRQAAEDPRVHCLHRQGKQGLGTALAAGMRYAIEHGYQYVITIDADLSHAPEALPRLIAGMGAQGLPAVDVMIGSRYTAGGSIDGWPLTRHLLSRSVNLYCRWLLGLSPRDCSSGLRCYRVALLSRLDFGAIRSLGYAFEEEVLWRLARLGARFGEIPIHFVNRREGISKVSRRELTRGMRALLSLTMERWLGRS